MLVGGIVMIVIDRGNKKKGKGFYAQSLLVWSSPASAPRRCPAEAPRALSRYTSEPDGQCISCERWSRRALCCVSAAIARSAP